MSLKAFHIVFITAAILLALGFGGWLFAAYFSPEGQVGQLIAGIASVLAAVGLVVYECYFLKKTRNLSYL